MTEPMYHVYWWDDDGVAVVGARLVGGVANDNLPMVGRVSARVLRALELTFGTSADTRNGV